MPGTRGYKSYYGNNCRHSGEHPFRSNEDNGKHSNFSTTNGGHVQHFRCSCSFASVGLRILFCGVITFLLLFDPGSSC